MLASTVIYIVYKVLSIYRVLPGFREFAVFEKIKRFFILFFGRTLERGGQGAGKGPNISRQSILKQGFQKTHSPMVLEVESFLLSIWLTSRRCAKFQIPNSILTWLFRHLNMTFLGYFTQFRISITVLARFCAIFIIFLTGSLLFPVVFAIKL